MSVFPVHVSQSPVSAQKLVGEVFNIVSQQSTARPGCIIELDIITNQVRGHVTSPHTHLSCPVPF